MFSGEILFQIFKLFGMWRPLSWNSKWKIFLYNFYSSISLIIYSTFAFSLLTYLLKVSEDIDSITLTLFYFFAAFTILIKMSSVIVQRKSIIESKNILSNKLCQPRDFYESEIQRKYSNISRFNTIIFLILTNICAASLFLAPLIKRNNISLPMKIWIPYSLDSKFAFLFTYFYQIIVLLMSAYITASVECLALRMMLQICTQLEIIIHRLQLLPKLRKKNDPEFIVHLYESRLIKECVKHHFYIYSLGEKLEELFGSVIFVQFFASVIDMCTLIYQLSRMNQNNINWTVIPLISTIIVQIYFYCFYGEKLIEKSLSVVGAVYHIEWTTITNQTKKDLIIIMNRASRPIKLKGLSFIVMSLDTFVKILKTSYSTYNLLNNRKAI